MKLLTALLDNVFGKKPKDTVINPEEQRIAEAKAALKQGDIAPAVQTVEDWSPLHIFKAITADNDEHALAAKKAVLPLLAKRAGDLDGQGNVNCYNAGSGFASDIIQAYSAQGRAAECDTMIKEYYDLYSLHDTERQQNAWFDKFKSGAEEFKVLGACILPYVSSHKSLNAEDLAAILKFHPNEKEKIKWMKTLAHNEKQPRREIREKDQVFNVLLDHLATQDGQAPSASQSHAMEIMQRRFHRFYDVNPEKREQYLNVVTREMQKNSPHVMEHVFGDHKKTAEFLILHSRHLHDTQDVNKETRISDLLPSSLEGPQAAQARLHFATQSLGALTQHYITRDLKDGDTHFDSYAHSARDIATLSRQILMDESLAKGAREKLQAQTVLTNLINVENTRKQKDVADIEAVKNTPNIHSYSEVMEKWAAQREAKIGFGLATLDILETNGTAETIQSAQEIRKRPAVSAFSNSQP